MLFFFEFLFFAVALLVIVAGEMLGREWAASVGLGVTTVSLLARFIVGRRVPLPAWRDRSAFHAASEGARWWRTALDSWSHFNRALLFGTTVLALWAVVSRVASDA